MDRPRDVLRTIYSTLELGYRVALACPGGLVRYTLSGTRVCGGEYGSPALWLK